jgi:mono/diheme cytochrome c family protein
MPARKSTLAALAAGSIFTCAWATAAEPPAPASPEAARGKYLVQITGCNDCHTEGYATANGDVEESKWLTGDVLGWRGPWGTTYAANLRLSAADKSADEFVALSRSPLRPPMPFFNLRRMSDADVKAIYAYLRHLGPAGKPAPAYVPPDKAPEGPFVQFPAPPPAN